jgi:hypothetical protein
MTTTKPWVQQAKDAGRVVPRWIAELTTEAEFNAMLELRERAVAESERSEALRAQRKADRAAARKAKR